MSSKSVLGPEVERALLAPPQQVPRVEYLLPFIEGARDVVAQELHAVVNRGQLSIVAGTLTTQPITVLVGLTGQLVGVVLFGMRPPTALAMIERMLGSPVKELDDFALSGIAELGNMIAGRAATLLEDTGLLAYLAPPVVIQGLGTQLSTAKIQRLCVPLGTSLGLLDVQLAIKSVGEPKPRPRPVEKPPAETAPTEAAPAAEAAPAPAAGPSPAPDAQAQAS
jgi:chemotaxis protein CheX